MISSQDGTEERLPRPLAARLPPCAAGARSVSVLAASSSGTRSGVASVARSAAAAGAGAAAGGGTDTGGGAGSGSLRGGLAVSLVEGCCASAPPRPGPGG